MASMNMKSVVGRVRKYFSRDTVKYVFLVALLLFFVYLLSRYFMRGWYEGMEGGDADKKEADKKEADKKDATTTDADKKDATAEADKKPEADAIPSGTKEDK